jgi:hypothetical protein
MKHRAAPKYNVQLLEKEVPVTQRYLVFKKEALPGIELHNACNGSSEPRFPADTPRKFVWGICDTCTQVGK